MSRARWTGVALLAVGGACASSPTAANAVAWEGVQGAYDLVSWGGTAVPTPVAANGGATLAGCITLGPSVFRDDYTHRYSGPQGVAVVQHDTFSGRWVRPAPDTVRFALARGVDTLTYTAHLDTVAMALTLTWLDGMLTPRVFRYVRSGACR